MRSTEEYSVRSILSYILAYPIMLPMSFYATWWSGRLRLGDWPRPEEYEKRLGGFFRAAVAGMRTGIA